MRIADHLKVQLSPSPSSLAGLLHHVRIDTSDLSDKEATTENESEGETESDKF